MSASGRLSLLCVVLLAAVVCAKNVPVNSVHKLKDTSITVVKDIRNFAKEHPGVSITPMNKEQGNARSQSIRYSLGGRVNGDDLVAQGSDTYNYAAPNDVSLQLTYPEEGTGAIVTFVQIVSTQSNEKGNAYVVAGGIGQRFISIIIEAQETEYFSYTAQYYGSK